LLLVLAQMLPPFARSTVSAPAFDIMGVPGAAGSCVASSAPTYTGDAGGAGYRR